MDKSKTIPGKQIADQINENTKSIVATMQPKPRLGIVLASNDPASHKYVEMKMAKAAELGIETKLYHFDEYVTKDELISETKKFKNNEAILGVLLQLPLFDHLDSYTSEIVNTIDPGKDVDGLTPFQQGNASFMLQGSILPAAVEAVLESLNYCFDENLTWDNIVKNYRDLKSLKGKNVVIVNNSNLIGKPLSNILSTLNATITLANSATQNLEEFTRNADIIISATGKTNIIDASMIKEGSILIDITSTNVDGKVQGDFKWSEELVEKCSFITPVPGGIGPLTLACLLRNMVR